MYCYCTVRLTSFYNPQIEGKFTETSGGSTSEMVLCPILWGINYHIFMPVRLDEISNSIVDTRLKFVYCYQKKKSQFIPPFFDNVNFKR
jgi:hypothetical protein